MLPEASGDVYINIQGIFGSLFVAPQVPIS